MPGEHLIVSGIRKCQAIGDVSNAALSLVAKDLSLFGGDIPKERKKRPATLRDVIAPVVAAQAIDVVPDPAIFFIQQGRICAGEYLLPAQAIADDQDNRARLQVRRTLLGEYQLRRKQNYDCNGKGSARELFHFSFDEGKLPVELVAARGLEPRTYGL